MSKNTKLEKTITKLVKSSFVKNKLNTVEVGKIVNSLKKLPKGEAIQSLSMYLSYLKKELDQHRLIIESPVKLTQAQVDEVTKIVSKSEDVMETEVVINPTLLAGFRLKIGDQVYEDSIDERIKQIGEVIHD